MFGELGIPADAAWPDEGPAWRNEVLRRRIQTAAPTMRTNWEADRLGWESAILRSPREVRSHLAALAVAAADRTSLDRELLLLVGQALEMSATWTAIAEALATSTQNAHQVYTRRLAAVRASVESGSTVESAIDEHYWRRGG